MLVFCYFCVGGFSAFFIAVLIFFSFLYYWDFSLYLFLCFFLLLDFGFLYDYFWTLYFALLTLILGFLVFFAIEVFLVEWQYLYRRHYPGSLYMNSPFTSLSWTTDPEREVIKKECILYFTLTRRSIVRKIEDGVFTTRRRLILVYIGPV